MHRAGKISRVRIILEVDACLKKKVHVMFDLKNIIDNDAYRNMVWVLYMDLDLFHLPPPKKNINEFLIEINEMGFEARAD